MGGSKYLSQMLSRYDGDIKKALAAYNAGPGNVDKYDGISSFSRNKKLCEQNYEYLFRLKLSRQMSTFLFVQLHRLAHCEKDKSPRKAKSAFRVFSYFLRELTKPVPLFFCLAPPASSL